MPCRPDAPWDAVGDRARRDVHALRAQMAARQVAADRRTSAGTMLAAAAGGLVLTGAALVAGLATDAVRAPGLDEIAARVAAWTAAEMVERVVAVY